MLFHVYSRCILAKENFHGALNIIPSCFLCMCVCMYYMCIYHLSDLSLCHLTVLCNLSTYSYHVLSICIYHLSIYLLPKCLSIFGQNLDTMWEWSVTIIISEAKLRIFHIYCKCRNFKSIIWQLFSMIAVTLLIWERLVKFGQVITFSKMISTACWWCLIVTCGDVST